MKKNRLCCLILCGIICLASGCTDKPEISVPEVLPSCGSVASGNSEEVSNYKDPKLQSAVDAPYLPPNSTYSLETKATASQTLSTKNNDIDVDLTSMSGTMVFAEVYQMMMHPDDYIGKIIKIRGIYYSSYYAPMDTHYFFVVVSDATACCSQGIEFVWDDNSHYYPDAYPAEESEIEITGVFEAYKDDGDENIYYHLLTDDIVQIK